MKGLEIWRTYATMFRPCTLLITIAHLDRNFLCTRNTQLWNPGSATALSIALKARWPWLKRSEPSKPWANLPIQVSREVAGLISVAVITEVGNGSNTLFWEDKWLDGKRIQDIAPLVYALVPKRSSRRTVLEALTGEKWTEDIQGEIGSTALIQYLEL